MKQETGQEEFDAAYLRALRKMEQSKYDESYIGDLLREEIEILYMCKANGILFVQ